MLQLQELQAWPREDFVTFWTGLPIPLRNLPWRQCAAIAQHMIASSPLLVLADNRAHGKEAVTVEQRPKF